MPVPDLPNELWRAVLHLISGLYKHQMYGVNRLFMDIVFAEEYRQVQLSANYDESRFLPSLTLRRTVIHLR
jgi:hypothetical protein